MLGADEILDIVVLTLPLEGVDVEREIEELQLEPVHVADEAPETAVAKLPVTVFEDTVGASTCR